VLRRNILRGIQRTHRKLEHCQHRKSFKYASYRFFTKDIEDVRTVLDSYKASESVSEPIILL